MDPEFDFKSPSLRVKLYDDELTLMRGGDIARGPGRLIFVGFRKGDLRLHLT
jgi:hypothetical protein